MPPPRSLTPARLSPLLLGIIEEGGNAAVLVALTHRDPSKIGYRILVTETVAHGSLEDREADAGAIALARRALGGDPGILSGTHTLPTEGGGRLEAFLELHHPPWELIIVGAGHIALPLSTMGSLLGLRVSVLDDRPQFATRERFPQADTLLQVDFSDPFADVSLHRWSHVVLVTRGHKYDFECLRRVLQAEPLPRYIGMIGSRRRVRATFDALLREGIPREKLEMVHSPIGLDIGGETPAEIAVSVAAELVHHWRGGTGRPLMEKEQVLHRFQPGEGGEDPFPDRSGGRGPHPDPLHTRTGGDG